MRNIKLVIEYDGSAYHGWQKQCNAHATIQQILEDKIEIVTQEKPKLHSSGRTDAGVHAMNQVANFKTSSLIPPYKIMLGVNSLLPWISRSKAPRRSIRNSTPATARVARSISTGFSTGGPAPASSGTTAGMSTVPLISAP